MTTMNEKTERRARLVKAMELVARCVNDEDDFSLWLEAGVADGDITEKTTLEEVAALGYCEDKAFAFVLATFARVMEAATVAGSRGAFYADGIIS
ncbi:MAG: hypothetical protein IKQ55_03800 [Kiritimatiellae bacterium]|nr:hypothetical protein [Kiritimatiellia bacterium]